MPVIAERIVMTFLGRQNKPVEITECPITDLREVRIYWIGDRGDYRSHFVHKDHVDRMVLACVKLHGYPAVNPHNNTPTSLAARITVGAPAIKGPYWWSTPNLMKNDDHENGAPIIDFGWPYPEVIWERSKAQAVTV